MKKRRLAPKTLKQLEEHLVCLQDSDVPEDLSLAIALELLLSWYKEEHCK